MGNHGDERAELLTRLEQLRELCRQVGKGELAPPQRQALAAALRTVDGLRLRAGRDQLGAEPRLGPCTSVDPELVLDETLAELSAQADLRNSELVAELAPGLPAAVRVEAEALREGLRELVGHVLARADSASDVVVRVEQLPTTGGRAELSLRVRGPETLPPPGANRLPFCQALAHRHGGTLQVESIIDDRGQERPALVWRLRLEVVESARQEHLSGTLAGTRVLVVDDSACTRAACLQLLTSLACEAETADSVAGALAACHAAEQDGRPFAVALVDVRMPGRGGFALAEELRRSGRPIPALALVHTNHRQGDLERAAELGFEMLLRKPLGRAALRAALERLVRAEDRGRRSG